MTWPSNDYYVKQHMNDYFAQRNMEQHFREQNDRFDELTRSSASSSSNSRKRSPDTSVSIALEKKFAEQDRQFRRSLTASSSFSLLKLFSSCFPTK